MNIVQARRRVRRQRSSIRGDSYVLGGGLNEVDSPLAITPGELLAVQNYEPRFRQGYCRLQGYEVFDGQPSPSALDYYIVNYENASSVFDVGDEIESDTTIAYGRVLAVEETYLSATNHATDSWELTTWDALNKASLAAELVGNAWPGDFRWETGQIPVGSLWPLIESASFGEHYIQEDFTGISAAETWTVSLFFVEYNQSTGLTPSPRNKARFTIIDNTGIAVDVKLDLVTGDIINVGKNKGVGIVATVTVSAYDKGPLVVWRVVVTFTARDTGKHFFRAGPLDNFANSGYIGNGVSGIVCTGLQIEQTATAYDWIRTSGGAASAGAGYLVVDKLSGDVDGFEDGDRLTLKTAGAPYRMDVNGDQLLNSAGSLELHMHYRELAAIEQRALITAVPGEGPVRGVCIYDGTVYAVRNAAGGATAVLHKATSAGWTAITPDVRLAFDNGTGSAGINAGDTVTGAGGANAVVKKVEVTTGAWGTNAAGILILGPVTAGPFVNNEVLSTGAGAQALANEAEVTQAALPPGGKYEFRVHNFYGHSSLRAMYAVNGVGQAFEYESSADSFAYIDTGMTTDTPNHLEVYDEQLIMSFVGGSIQYSAVSGPHAWNVTVGAGEIGVGDEVQALLHMPGQAVFAFTRDEVHYFLGTFGDPNTFFRDKFAQSTGAFPWTVLPIGQGVFLDDRGFATLETVDRKGDYLSNTISQKIPKTLTSLQPLVTDGVINRKRSLARWFCSDGAMITCGFDGRQPTGFTVSRLPITGGVYCSFSGEDGNGVERTYLGGSDGFVYEMDAGWNFNGEPIPAFTVPAFNHQSTPGQNKRYRRAQMEIDATGDVTLSMGVLLSGASPNAAAQAQAVVSIIGGGGLWGVANWGQFRWGGGGGIVPLGLIKLEGSGTNISLVTYHNETEELPHHLNSVVLHYSPRRLERRTLPYS